MLHLTCSPLDSQTLTWGGFSALCTICSPCPAGHRSSRMALRGAARSRGTLRPSLAVRAFSDAISSPSSVRFVPPSTWHESSYTNRRVGRTAKAGTQVVIPYRDEDDKRHLKVTGDLGQIVSMVRTPFRLSFRRTKEPLA
jgi:hypothetical protein